MDGPYHDYNPLCSCGYCGAMRSLPPAGRGRRLVVPGLALAAIAGAVGGAFEALESAARLLTPAHEEDPTAVVRALKVLAERLDEINETVAIVMEENHGS